MVTYAIVPARKGSQRIPNKNTVSFVGKPMLAWTIEAAKNAQLVDRVFVDTDCEEIRKVAVDFGAEVPFLRDQFADEHSSVSEATLYFVERLIERGEPSECEIVQLMATCPLRTSDLIDQAIQQFREKQLQFQISVFSYGFMNPWWALKRSESGPAKTNEFEFLFEKKIKSRSQDLENLYCPTGAIWAAKGDALRDQKTFYGRGFGVFEMDWKKGIDIDDYSDLHLAELLMRQ